MLFNHHLWFYSVLQVAMDVTTSFDGGLRCATWNTRHLVGSFLSKLEQRNQTQICQEAI